MHPRRLCPSGAILALFRRSVRPPSCCSCPWHSWSGLAGLKERAELTGWIRRILVALVPYLRRTLMTSFPMRTKLMRTSSAITGLLSCGGLSLFFVCSAQARITVSADPEDSPLYAVSRENAIADMRRRDHVVQAFGAAGVETILVVEGKQWRTAPASGRGPRPLGVTTDISCGIPTMCTSCTPTSCASVTSLN